MKLLILFGLPLLSFRCHFIPCLYLCSLAARPADIPDDEEDYMPHCPPEWPYRNPPYLVDTDWLIGQSIVKLSLTGSYGMGGPGWCGIHLAEGKLLLYTMWASMDRVDVETPDLHGYPIGFHYDIPNWTIQAVVFDDKQLVLRCQAPERRRCAVVWDDKQVVWRYQAPERRRCTLIFNENSGKPGTPLWTKMAKGKTMRQLWRVGSVGSSFWC